MMLLIHVGFLLAAGHALVLGASPPGHSTLFEENTTQSHIPGDESVSTTPLFEEHAAQSHAAGDAPVTTTTMFEESAAQSHATGGVNVTTTTFFEENTARCQGLAFVCTADFSASSHPTLRYLDASGSGMTPSDLTAHFYLVALRLSNCGLKGLAVLSFPNLKNLDVSWNAISHINLQSLRFLKNLKFLSLSGNPLVAVSNTALPVTWTLPFVRDTRDRLNPSSANTTSSLKLQSLDLSQTHLKAYSGTPFASVPDLKTLNMSRSSLEMITDDGFRSTWKLETLDVKGSQLQTFPNSLLRDLTQLQLVNADNFKLCCQAMLPEGFDARNCHAELV